MATTDKGGYCCPGCVLCKPHEYRREPPDKSWIGLEPESKQFGPEEKASLTLGTIMLLVFLAFMFPLVATVLAWTIVLLCAGAVLGIAWTLIYALFGGTL